MADVSFDFATIPNCTQMKYIVPSNSHYYFKKFWISERINDSIVYYDKLTEWESWNPNEVIAVRPLLHIVRHSTARLLKPSSNPIFILGGLRFVLTKDAQYLFSLDDIGSVPWSENGRLIPYTISEPHQLVEDWYNNFIHNKQFVLEAMMSEDHTVIHIQPI